MAALTVVGPKTGQGPPMSFLDPVIAGDGCVGRRGWLCLGPLQPDAWTNGSFGSDSADAPTLAARPLYPRKLTTCCNAQVVSLGPKPAIPNRSIPSPAE